MLGMLLTGSVGVWAITEGIKRAPSITSISPGNYAKVRTVAVAVSAVVALVMRWTDGNLDVASVQGAGQAIISVIALFAGSQAVYVAAKAKEDQDAKKGKDEKNQ